MSVSLTELMLRVRRLADVENATDRFPDEEVQGYVNRGLARWHRVLASEFEGFWTTSTTIVVASGTNVITLGSGGTIADFLSLVRVQYADASAPAGWRKVVAVSIDDMERFSFSMLGRGRGYQLQQGRLFLFPETDASGTYRVWYVARYVPATDPTTLIEDWDDWVQLAVYDAAIQIKRKDEEDAQDLIGEREMLSIEVRAAAAARNVGGAAVTQNVQDDNETDWWRFR